MDCMRCEKIFEEGEVKFEIEGMEGYYCQDCIDEMLNNGEIYVCESCGCYIASDEDYLAEDSRGDIHHYCYSCSCNETWVCCNCETRFTVLVARCKTEDGNYICRDCADNSYYQCDNCGCYVHMDNAYEIGGAYYCEDCHNNLYLGENGSCLLYDRKLEHNKPQLYIYNYHDSLIPALIFYGDNEIVDTYNLDSESKEEIKNNFKGFGIELEVCRDKRDNDIVGTIAGLNEILNKNGVHAIFSRDGSLGDYGFEIVTMPHTKTAFNKLNLNKMCDFLTKRGYVSHNWNGSSQCGLHVHVNNSLFGKNEVNKISNIAKILAFFDIYWGEISNISRRGTTSYHYSTRPDINNVIREKKYLLKYECEKIAKDKNTAHSNAINLRNSDTVEFRMFRGTLNYNSLINSVDFILEIVKASKRITWKQIENSFYTYCLSIENTLPFLWLSKMNNNLLNYISSGRHAFEDASNFIIAKHCKEEI